MIRSRFWKIYAVTAAAAFAVLAVGFAVFYSFIDSYEQSQPEYAAMQYADSLTDAALAAMLEASLPGISSPYESTDSVRTAWMTALSEVDGSFSVRKNYGKYTTSEPVFYILRGDTAICEIALTPAESGAFGMGRWNVGECSLMLTEWLPARSSYSLYVPVGAILTLNGIPAEKGDLTETGIAYTYASIYEPSADAAWELYKISDLCAEPDAVCTLNGEDCPVVAEGNTLRFLYPASAAGTYTVTAPAGANVLVNGIPLRDTEITGRDISYDYVSAEAAHPKRPTALRYTIAGLFVKPEISGTLSGVPLVFTAQGNDFTASYPEALRYTAVIRVPAGSDVTLHGQNCAQFREKSEAAFPELASVVQGMPQYDVYRITGLYVNPEDALRVSLGGEQLPVQTERTNYDVRFTAKFPDVENMTLSERAMAFAKSYITYTGQGFNNTDRNLADVLSYVLPGSDTYKRIEKSRIAFIYVTPVLSSEYNRLETSSVTRYTDTLYECTVEFDVRQNTYGHIRDYAGTYRLVFVKKNDAWMVADMQIITK